MYVQSILLVNNSIVFLFNLLKRTNFIDQPTILELIKNIILIDYVHLKHI